MLDFCSRQPSANSHERSIDMGIQAKQATVKGPAQTFTGDVWFDVITRGEDYARMRVNVVRFAPSARTAWHAHPGGQTLYVTEGRGPVQARGGEILEIRPGDVIYTPPGEWHWHGAAPDHFMTHIAMVEARRRRQHCHVGCPHQRRGVPRPRAAPGGRMNPGRHTQAAPGPNRLDGPLGQMDATRTVAPPAA